MTNAKRDENRVTTMIGVSSVDLVTPTRVAVNPTTGALILDPVGLDARFLKLDCSNSPLIGTDSTTFFQVQQADTTVVLNIDTTNARVGIGTLTTQDVTLFIQSEGDATAEVGFALNNPSTTAWASIGYDGLIAGVSRSSITFQRSGVTNAGMILLRAKNASNVSTRGLDVTGSSVIVNAGQIATMDFLVHGDTNTNVFAVDVSTERVGIGTATPATDLDVAGQIRTTGHTAPASGTGMEMSYIAGSNLGDILVYDRTGGAFKALRLRSSQLTISSNVKIDGDANEIQLAIKANATQTANILEIQDSSSGVLAAVGSDGRIGVAGDVSTTTFFNLNTSAMDDTTYRALLMAGQKSGSATGYAIYTDLQTTGTGSVIGILASGQTQTNNDNNVAAVIGLDAWGRAKAGTGTVTDVIGGRFDAIISARVGTVTTATGVLVESITGASTNYAIYTNAGLVRFGDKVGIGISPTSELHINGDILLEEGGQVGTATEYVKFEAGEYRIRYEFLATGTDPAHMDFFRSANTTGVKDFRIFKGDNSATIEGRIAVDGDDSYFQIGGGGFGIGTNAPSGAFHVNGISDQVQTTIQAHSSQTANILEIQKSDTSVLAGFDERGILFSDGGINTDSVYIGKNAGNIGHTNATLNVGIGTSALSSVTTGDGSVAIGSQAGEAIDVGRFNTLYGHQAGLNLTSGDQNIFLGSRAGLRQTTADNLLIIDNQSRANVATELTNSILYGVMAAAPADQTLRINANTHVAGEVEAGGAVPKFKITALGGMAIKLTNNTGANTIQGQVVMVDPAEDDAFILCAGNTDTDNANIAIGIVFESGVADEAEAWIVVSGIADVAMEDNVAAVRSFWIGASEAEDGYADVVDHPKNAPDHMHEIGHCIESVAAGGGGTHILARCIIHFN